jgi:hypothetical protein
MKIVLHILLAAFLTWSVSYSLGAMLLRAARLKFHRSEERFFAFITGSVALSTLVFLLTAVGLARKWTFWSATLVILAAGVWRRVYQPSGERLPGLPRWWALAFWCGFAAFTYWYVGNALLPETSADAVSYHVALVARYAREHHFPLITTNMYANLTEGVEMLFLYAFMFGKYSAPRMVEFLFLLTLPFGILAYARRIGRPVAGVVAAILVYASPIFGLSGTVGLIDVAGAAVAFALFYAVEVWRLSPDAPPNAQTRQWLLIGALAGFAFDIKYTLGIGVAYAAGTVLFVSWRRKQGWLRPPAVIGVAAFALMAPWLVKNTIEVRNPVSPFFNRVFPNPYIDIGFEEEYTGYLSHYEGVKPWQIPREVTVSGERLQGLLGPVFLLAPLALIALRYPAGRQLLLAAAIFLIPYPNNIGTRFLMAPAVFVALALGLVLEAVPPLAMLVVAVHCVLSWPPVIPRYARQYAVRIEHLNWRAAFRHVAEPDYLRTVLGDYDIGLALDRLVPASQPVMAGSIGNQLYHSREIVVPYESSFGRRLMDVMYRATIPDMQTTLRQTFTFDWRGVRRLRINLVDPGTSPWVVGEVRVYYEGKELPRDPSWRLRASANPWTIGRAFDNSPLTVWTSDIKGQGGMFLQIDFGRVRRIDKVTLDMPKNEAWAMMRVEAENGSISLSPVAAVVPWPARMRQAATDELKANGIHWMVFRDGDLLADDLLVRSAQWGITQVAESNGYRLWHLN